jgi:D-alanyl-D-alanine carboxypeptidase
MTKYIRSVKRSLLVLIALTIALNSPFLYSQKPLTRAQKETYFPLFSSKDSIRVLTNFTKEIESILNDKYIARSECGLAVYSLDTDRYYFAKDIDKPLTPASATKLVTSFTAMTRLGRDFRLRTSVYTDAKSIGDTVLRGNIYLVGRGDAMLGVNDIEYLADQIKNYGIRRIEGNVYADGSYFDGITDRKIYSGDRDRVVALPPITALGIERNIATVLVTSGHQAGEYVNVQLIPDSDVFSRWITAKVRGYGKSYLQDERKSFGKLFGEKIIKRAGDQEYLAASMNMRSIRVSTKLVKSGKQHFTVRGYLYPNKTVSYRYHIIKPELAAAGALKNRLEADGIEVSGNTEKRSLDKLEKGRYITLLAEFSRPLIDMVYELNKESDNFLAEHLFKIIGAELGDSPRNSDDTRRVTARTLDSLDIPFAGCAVNDGSGLSRRNLLTARTLIELLKHSRRTDFAMIYDSTLSLAGIDGTLEKRMASTAAEANLHAKTGTLRNVSALVGFVQTLDGETLCFAFLFRGRYVSHYKDIEDRLGVLMSEFFYYHEKY